MDAPVALLYPDWPQYANRLRAAVEHLTADQLALRAGSEHGAIWQLAAHAAGARVFWLCGVFGEPGAEITPFADPLSGFGWEDEPDRPRSGEELRWALDSSWAVVRDCLERWRVDELDQSATRTLADGRTQLHTRPSVLNRLFSHDAFHGGEISQLLGLHELPPIDLWVRPATT
ncbi:hypothetical protein BH23CHL7_BH23CHL7_15470 [soil metagenome]